eukprot:scaffold677447_cov52-Prasinocladus_malaysianus.AAC.1
MSTNCYKSTHFKKLQDALKKEYQLKIFTLEFAVPLQSLSNPKQKADVKSKEARLSNKIKMTSKTGSGGKLMPNVHPDLKHAGSEHKMEPKQLKDGSQLLAGMALDMP